jgi:hypothetical protein
LGFLIDLNLTKAQYQKIRLQMKERGADLLPTYNLLQKSKKESVPGGILISEDEVSVPLKNILDHTASRLISTKTEEIKNLMRERNLNIVKADLTTNWGCDGSSNQSVYQYSPENSTKLNSSNLFASTISYLQLNSDEIGEIWRNEKPHSIESCRPISVKFQKEKRDLTLETKKNMDRQIDELAPLVIHLDDSLQIVVSYKVFCRAIDGHKNHATF